MRWLIAQIEKGVRFLFLKPVYGKDYDSMNWDAVSRQVVGPYEFDTEAVSELDDHELEKEIRFAVLCEFDEQTRAWTNLLLAERESRALAE